ncbi:MAG: hypothetical protein R3C03_03825 [Pirellulaceae bacterium]
MTVPLLYFLSGQGFGISTSLQQIGAMCTPGSRLTHFRDYDWKKESGFGYSSSELGLVGSLPRIFYRAKRLNFFPKNF